MGRGEVRLLEKEGALALWWLKLLIDPSFGYESSRAICARSWTELDLSGHSVGTTLSQPCSVLQSFS